LKLSVLDQEIKKEKTGNTMNQFLVKTCKYICIHHLVSIHFKSYKQQNLEVNKVKTYH
jgi:hypothetical protein